MALPSEQEQLSAAWRALSGVSDGTGWKVVEIRRDQNCSLRAGRQMSGNQESLVVGISGIRPDEVSHLPNARGFTVTRTDQLGDDGDCLWFAVVHQPGTPLELFTLMAVDIVRLLSQIGNQEGRLIYSQLMARIRAWQDFMRRDSSGVLSLEEEVGLIGELLTLKDMLVCGIVAQDAVEAWAGPEDGLHDFLIGVGAVEVKTTTAQAGFIAEIGSLDQLDDSARKPLYVAGVRLAQTADGQSLPELCEEIASIIRQGSGPVASFMGRLLSAGYSPEMRDQYVRRLRCDEIGYRLVTAESPRLISATVPTAVRWVRYALNLDAIPVVASSFSEIAGNLGVSQTWN
jgi:hypothetical protein